VVSTKSSLNDRLKRLLQQRRKTLQQSAFTVAEGVSVSQVCYTSLITVDLGVSVNEVNAYHVDHRGRRLLVFRVLKPK